MSTGRIVIALLLATFPVSCRQGMYDQPRAEAFSESDFFEDGASMRPLPEGTVPRGGDTSELWRKGIDGEFLATRLPVELDRDLLERGRARFEIYCAVCHGYTGKGDGTIVQRGFPPPPSFHEPRLREAPIGHFVNVISEGYGVMYSYAARVPPADRWAIAAYLRALQRSRDVPVAELSPEEKRMLPEGGADS